MRRTDRIISSSSSFSSSLLSGMVSCSFLVLRMPLVLLELTPTAPDDDAPAGLSLTKDGAFYFVSCSFDSLLFLLMRRVENEQGRNVQEVA